MTSFSLFLRCDRPHRALRLSSCRATLSQRHSGLVFKERDLLIQVESGLLRDVRFQPGRHALLLPLPVDDGLVLAADGLLPSTPLRGPLLTQRGGQGRIVRDLRRGEHGVGVVVARGVRLIAVKRLVSLLRLLNLHVAVHIERTVRGPERHLLVPLRVRLHLMLLLALLPVLLPVCDQLAVRLASA